MKKITTSDLYNQNEAKGKDIKNLIEQIEQGQCKNPS